ncbi:SIR2 family protein [Streptomyces sp. NPDC126522]|uniref:P-loop NTPase n=1 Tax=Streptomyces sp. NPDC126522 TaxID=3155211 RepID=UPI003316B352
MSDEQWDSMMRAITESKYQLLLGAGASLDSEGPMGRLPGGWDLAQEMAQSFSLPGDPRGNLRQVVSMARSRTTKDGQDVLTYFADRFSNCTAPPWYANLVSIPWRYIWSLNIDDSVENAYRKQFSDHATKELVSVSWTDSHRVPSGHQVVLVHLHGVAWANRTDDLVFDISSYLYAATQRYRWHNIFADRYADTPTIILGASLSDEFDLENVLDKGRLEESSEPSIIVMPTIDEFNKARFRNWGLIPVEATAEEFLAKVRESWSEYFHQADISSDNPSRINPNTLSFLSQWHPMNTAAEYRVDDRHDFYEGHEPVFSDILRDLDSERTLTRKILREAQSEEHQKLICLTGSAFTGKSTIALRVAKELAVGNWTPYLLDPELRPDSAATLWWLRQYPRTLLVVEGAADFARDLAGMALRAKKLGIPFMLLAVERRSRARELRRSFAGTEFTDLEVSDRLSDREVDALIGKLSDRRRLGIVTNASPREQAAYFTQVHRRELFSAMSNLEEADGFRNRVRAGYSRLKNDTERAVFQATCITSSLGYGLPFGAAASVCGLPSSELNVLLQSNSLLGDFIRVSGSRLHPRHRAFGSYMLEHAFRPQENYDVTLKLAEHYGVQISPAAISSHTFAYRMVRQLLDHEILTAWLGAERLDSWYEALQETYTWNARYWEQRALAASKRGRHAAATSWARQAIAQHKDAFALNTLATVLFRKYLDEGDADNDKVENFLEVGAYLEEARAMAQEDSEYPYITFFNYTLEWATRSKKATGSLDPRIVRRWNDWMYLVDISPVGRSLEVRRSLESLKKRWLRLAQ